MVQIYMLIGVLRVASIQQKEINWNKIIEHD